mmetsp:Transcript_26295/g.61139  ORF Transcript_26295/g.61139 Transcript_26295/m.61139 type:complete len:87 (+) Transcript_26295:1647-1907(+)
MGALLHLSTLRLGKESTVPLIGWRMPFKGLIGFCAATISSIVRRNPTREKEFHTGSMYRSDSHSGYFGKRFSGPSSGFLCGGAWRC